MVLINHLSVVSACKFFTKWLSLLATLSDSSAACGFTKACSVRFTIIWFTHSFELDITICVHWVLVGFGPLTEIC